MLRFAVLLALVLVSGVASRARPRERLNVRRRAPLPPECGDEIQFPKQCEQSPLEISFIVDASSSISRLNFVRCLNFLEDFVGHFVIGPEKVRVSMVTFAQKADENNAFGFSDYTDLPSLKNAIANTNYTEYAWTNTSAGLWYMLKNQAKQARHDVRHLVIVITDGRSQETSKTKAASADLQALRENRSVGMMEIFAVGVGRDVHYPELTTIAGEGRNVFEVESYALLESLMERLILMSCKEPTFPACKMDPVELAFVIDSSSSIQDTNFTEGMDFVKSFASSFKIHPKHVRLATITYDIKENADQAIQFDDYVDSQGFLRKLEAVQYTAGGFTNTGAGIKYMTENLMTRARNNTGKICIVITDGNSQEWQKTEAAAEAARNAGITMYAIGVGSNVDPSELNRIAGNENRTYTVDDYSKLNTFKETLLTVTCDAALKHIAAHGKSQKSGYS